MMIVLIVEVAEDEGSIAILDGLTIQNRKEHVVM